MIIPIRCISCGKVIANKWEAYDKEVSAGKSPKKVLDELGIKRYCCRSMFLTNVELIGEISRFRRRSIPIIEEPQKQEFSEIEDAIARKVVEADAEKAIEQDAQNERKRADESQ